MCNKTGEILTQLRVLMKEHRVNDKPISALIVYSSDAHQSEYPSNYDLRRGFVSGFNGSAGTAVVTLDKAALWTDGRYYLQAETELDENWTLMRDGTKGVPTICEWLAQQLPVGAVVATDPKLISYDEWLSVFQQLNKSGQELYPMDENIVDIVWNKVGRVRDNLTQPYVYDIKYAGKRWEDKVKEIREDMRIKSVSLLVLSALDDIAWLLNLRGSDVECTTVFKSYVILGLNKLFFFIDQTRLTDDVLKHLGIGDTDPEVIVEILPYDHICSFLQNPTYSDCLVWICPFSSALIALSINEKKLFRAISPVTIKKAVKNSIEIENIKYACNKDAACLCQYYGYLSKKVGNVVMNEVEASDVLYSIRSKMENFLMLSFPTISSSGPNCAVIHYHAHKDTARTLSIDEIYLCDAGSEFSEGTTDITRTFHFGQPTDYQKECYTLVLKGHIALATAVFPRGTRGHKLDSFARFFLWKHGLEYRHGTGHGIGMCLNVHEGPQKISYLTTDYMIEAGCILSNEPGYYEDGEFGIRLENMIMAVDVKPKYNYQNIGFLGFETLSLIPFHKKLINVNMLTSEEVAWINAYHEKCKKIIEPILQKFGFTDGIDYLLENTTPL